MKRTICAVALVTVASSAALGQAVTSISGGSQFTSFFGGNPGDVVGFRFTVNSPIVVTHLGIWNGDSNGQTAEHEVGIWENATMSLLTSTVVPVGAPATGAWNYERTSSITLLPGVEYTAGAMYLGTDGDNYLSNPSSVISAPEVNIGEGVAPSAGSLGFVYPTVTSAGNSGRYGPNFLFIPAPGAAVLLGFGGLLAARRRR